MLAVDGDLATSGGVRRASSQAGPQRTLRVARLLSHFPLLPFHSRFRRHDAGPGPDDWSLAQNTYQADALRIGHGPHRRRASALRHQVLFNGDFVSGVRRRVALPLSLGGGGIPGAGKRGPPRVDQFYWLSRRYFLGSRRLSGDARAGVRLCLAEGGVPVAVALSDSILLTQLDKLA